MRQETGNRGQGGARRRRVGSVWHRERARRVLLVSCLLSLVSCLFVAGCGYTTRPGLAPHLQTVYVKPFTNKIDVTRLSRGHERFPIYRHQMEVDLTEAVISRYQFTGLLRPAAPGKADCLLEGELIGFRRDALRYDTSANVEEWRLSLIVSLKFTDETAGIVLWEETSFAGDTTYFALGAGAESESEGLDRAITDLARRIVERTVEDW